MEIQINGEVYTLELELDGMIQLADFLGAHELEKLGEKLPKISYKNIAKIVAMLLNCNGHDLTEDDVRKGAKDPGLPLNLIKHITEAIAPQQSDVAEKVAEGN